MARRAAPVRGSLNATPLFAEHPERRHLGHDGSSSPGPPAIHPTSVRELKKLICGSEEFGQLRRDRGSHADPLP